MYRLFIVSLLVSLLVACTAPFGPAQIANNRQVYDDKVLYISHDYMISSGDQIEISYHIDVRKQDVYRIAVSDQVRIEFPHYPQFDRSLNVRPDGMITVPHLGDIEAFGFTPMELAAKIEEAYTPILRNPKCTVALVRYGESIRELKESIKTATRGQSRLALVQPDGRIAIPLIEPMRVAGMRVEEIQKEINDEYQKLVPGMFTSVTLINATGNRVYIMGAVKEPGYYQLQGPTTVTQAVAMAKGFMPNAVASDTLLITRDERNNAVGRLVDIENIFDTGNIGSDTLLRQADVIYVPTSRLGRAAIVGDTIRRLIPADLGLIYSVSESVNFIHSGD
ncbi:polysaccharide biosynthesis/export family protein [Pseudoalteromonas tunicata]|jgi:polysaccharide export outer membrane protein|uniref:Polysaccharide biosynthesis/export protein n=1 Tax=Pseudoalteromonas tunicata D2 TaxID=87626 RepID=A4C655_9GAMM|nr:polysaccharide biosynthesis/export family protein [Pseudoalteromonas tunicata]ATC95432.1 hypothetical protein PTUN_a3041 [Pseudoalteromonas tunicata]AXT31010.1 hypothetical protein D1819_09540 [Pseudoalteromonas tunicata]EAR29459.1 polysaccharide biosynthesis/export protein [Pseudoalteromonas tunicata D2]MDP4985713.1 polysaccharide biosynthesis/export family protein [Pseudoalteromonas tunicata]MDP5212995.1 polysaccharide biosynthesis/export family protein [Pseudoalteromonas tunicata]